MKSFQTQTHYEVLEISVAANAADVKSAFDRLSNLYSDEQVALYGLVDPSMAASLQKRLKEAFEVLSDDDRRDAYDAKIGLPPRATPKPKPVAPPPPRVETPVWSSNYTFVTSAPAPAPQAPASFTYVVAAPSAPRPPPPAPEPETPAPQMSLPLPSAPVMLTIEPRASAPPAITAPMAAEPVALVAAPPPSERVTAPVPHLVDAAVPGVPAPRMSPPVEAPTAPAPRMSPPVEPAVTAPAPRMSPPVEAPSAPAPRMSPPVEAMTEPGPRLSPPVGQAITTPAPRVSPPVEKQDIAAPRVSPPVNAIEAPSLPVVAPPEPEVPSFAPINEESAITITRAKEYKPEPRPTPHEIPEGVEINGDLLRQVRMARGITLAQLSDRMRVSVRHLENVEGDRYAQLPAGVYLRGILMNLARELGLDGVRVARSYLTFVDANRSKG